MMPWHGHGNHLGCSHLNHEEDRTLPGDTFTCWICCQTIAHTQNGLYSAQPYYSWASTLYLLWKPRIPVAMMTAETSMYRWSLPGAAARYMRQRGQHQLSGWQRRYRNHVPCPTRSSAGQRALIVDSPSWRHCPWNDCPDEEFNTQVAGLAFMLAMERCPLSDLPEWPLMTFTGDGIHQRMVVQPARWLAQLGETNGEESPCWSGQSVKVI